MDSAPVLGNEDLAPDAGDRPDPESAPVEEYTEELQVEKVDALESAGIDETAMVASFDYAANGFTALLTKAEAESLATQKGVSSVVRDELHQLQTDNSPHFLGLDDRGGAYASGYTGKGVVVGVIDTGIWPEHPSFDDRGNLDPSPIVFDTIDLDPDPATDFISTGCDFGNTAYNPDDAPFACNNKLIGARNMRMLYDTLITPTELYHSARDYDGHGTHTASTAAGNAGVEASIFGRDFGEISGIAPDAWVVMYSACGDQGCFGGDLAGAIDQAVADGVEVINYSIGSDTPGLDGIDDIAFLFADFAGVFISVSAGNAGPGASTIGAPASTPWVITVGASEQNRAFVAQVKIDNGSKSRWSHFFKKDSGIFEGASVGAGTHGKFPFVDSADHGNEACDPAVDFDPDITGMVVLCPRSPGRTEKSLAVFEQGGVGMVMYNADDVQSLLTDNHYVPSVLVNHSDGLALKAYIAKAGSNARVRLTAAEAEHQRGNEMSEFSSRGPVGEPASPDIIKPDVTAPGVQILAGNTPTPTASAPGELFQAISGTSMSSPHVAGLLALLKQAHPEWTPAMARSALMTTARQDVRQEDGHGRADPFDFGAGHVDFSGRTTTEGSVFNPGLVYDAGVFDYLGFLCDTSASYVTPALTGLSCDDFGGIGFQTQSENLNYPSIGVSEIPGSKTVIRTVTNVSNKTTSYRAKVDEPRGFDVDVSPNRIKLAPGESATFEITFTNKNAPVGTWRFGSLTWDSGKNKVRSPIAVKAAAIEFPNSVSGTGVTGSATIPVAFGYTGTYTATAHGLAADAPQSGVVLHDGPDQEFDPVEDVPQGDVVAHPFTLSGSAFLRITMGEDDLTSVDPAATDIDLYLYFNGALIAQSTAGGTDELIDLEAPADGNYVLYVHGWQVVDPPPGVGYTFHLWDVPTAASSLSINAATPTTATIGTIGNVVVDWTGLAPGGSYLGAVSHSDGATDFGLTLVAVDS
jgi:subtilisin family serine protease